MSVTTHRVHRPGASTRLPSTRAAAARVGRASVWAFTAALLALLASLAGLLIDGVYVGEESTAAMLRAYDALTVLVAPALGVAAVWARRGSDRAHLVSAGLVAYLVYTYAYHLFGTGFNDLFLLHAAVVATGVVALVLQLTSLDVQAFTEEVRPRTRTRWAAVVLGLLAVALGGMWVYFAVHNAVTGEVPAGSRLVETDMVVHLGMALDLVLLVPLYGAASLLLWRGSPWGYVLGAVAVIAGVLHQVGYLLAMPFQVAADVPGAVSYDAGEPIIVALYLLSGALLFGPVRARTTREGRAR